MAQNIKHNPRLILARRKANSGYEIEICPRHQILAWRGVHAGVKPFMKWIPGRLKTDYRVVVPSKRGASARHTYHAQFLLFLLDLLSVSS